MEFKPPVWFKNNKPLKNFGGSRGSKGQGVKDLTPTAESMTQDQLVSEYPQLGDTFGKSLTQLERLCKENGQIPGG